MKLTKKTAANFLEVTPPTLYAWIKAGFLQEPLDQAQLYAFKQRYQKWYHCRKCYHEWYHKKPSTPIQCPKCQYKEISEGLKRPEDTAWVRPSAAAKIANRSAATVLNWIKTGILTNVGTPERPAVSKDELNAYLESQAKFRCLNCLHAWTRTKPGRPTRCSKCGSQEIHRV
jgi:DNA-directed RNA polymerase subunit RPC12/RpoP